MKKHISIFALLLSAFAAVGTAGAAGAAIKTAGYPYYTQSGTTSSDANVVYSTDGMNYIAIPPAGRKVGNWGWAQTGGEAQRYNSVDWEDPEKTGPTYVVPSGKKAAVYFACIPLTVTFNGNGGSGSMEAITNKNIDSSFTLTANGFTKTGYHFDHWANDLQKTFADQASVTGSDFWDTVLTKFHADLKAQWAANTYAVHFNGNGATGGSMADESFAYDETKALTANAFEKAGFGFDGWATNATKGAVLYKDKASVKNLTAKNGATVNLYARWTASGYMVTFNENGGGTPSPKTQKVTYGSTYGTLATCSRNGYSLDGWYTEKSGGTKITADTTVTITGAQTLYAHWSPITYTITYNGLKQGATNPNPTTYTIETTPITFKSPGPVTGFTFSKWSQDFIEKGSTGDKTVTASYLTWIEKPTPAQYELAYNGGPQTIVSGSNMSASGNQATVPGTYTATFTPNSGYCWNDGAVTSYSFNWTIVNASIENATVTQSGTLTYNGEPQQPQVYTRATVKGSQAVTWKYSKSPGDYVATMPSFIDAGNYTVYFEASAPYHNPAYGSFQVVIGRAKTAAVGFSSTQFSYTGREQGPDVTFTYCTEAAGSVKRGTNVGTYKVKATPDDNYAWSDGGTATRDFEWRIDEGSFTATVSAGEGGSGGLSYTYRTSQDPKARQITLPTRTGYQLTQWTASGYVGDAPTVSGTTLTIPARTAGDFTLTPTWTPVTYTITYDYKQGTASNPNPATYTIESDDIVFQPPSDVPGYKFDKWDLAFIPKGSTGDKTVRASYLTITYRPKVHSPLTYDGYAQACFQQPLPTGVVAETPGEARVVGTYTTTFRPMSGYCWDDGTTEPYVVDWQIVNAEIVVNEIRQSGSLTYTGEPQQPQVYARATLKGGQTVTWKYSTSQGDYTETMPSFTDAGSYTVYFEASAPNHDPATGSFTVKIDRAKMAAVTVTPPSLRYTRKEQGPTVTLQHCHEEADSVKRATDVGTYAVKATPDENYAWSNGETAVRELEWSIDDSLYTVQFDGNGGTGEMASTNLAYNEEYVVPECAFTKTGCEFQRWQVLIDNRTVTNYLAGTVVSNLTTDAGKVVTFKAEWLGRYTIAFDANGGEGAMASTNVERDVGFQLPSNAFTRTGYDFTTWTTNLPPNEKSLIADGATVTNLVTAGETCTLHALWDPHHYTITFDANGGKGDDPDDENCTYGEEVQLPTPSYDPPKNYATFIGWSTNKSDIVGVYTVSNLTAEADGIVALYAVWYYDVGPWSEVLDCNNLKFENKDVNSLWKIVEEGALPGSDKCLSHQNEDELYGKVYAELDESGTLTYWWKGEGDGGEHIFWVCLTEDEIWDLTIAEKTSIDSRDIRETQPWTKASVKITVPAGEKRYIWFAHKDSIPVSVSLDCVTWKPDGGGEPVPGDPVEVTAAGVVNGEFSLTIPTESNKDYGVWTNADLTVDSWGLMGEPQPGKGQPLEFKWTILPGFPQLFFRAHEVKYK